MQHSTVIAFAHRVRLHFVRVEQQVEEGTINTTRGLDDPGSIALLRDGVRITEILTTILAMPREVPVLPPVNAFPLLPAQDSTILYIECLFCIVGQLISGMRTHTQTIPLVHNTLVPVKAELLPVHEPLLHFAGVHKELQIPLLKLTLAEQEITRCHLVAISLTDLADAEGNLHTRGFEYVIKVQVDVLASFTAQVGLHFIAFDHTQVRFHQQIEGTGFCQFAATVGTFVLSKIFGWQVINAETAFTLFAVNETIHKVLDVAAGLPDTRMGNRRAVDPYHVLVQLHHRPPPVTLDIVAQFDT